MHRGPHLTPFPIHPNFQNRTSLFPPPPPPPQTGASSHPHPVWCLLPSSPSLVPLPSHPVYSGAPSSLVPLPSPPTLVSLPIPTHSSIPSHFFFISACNCQASKNRKPVLFLSTQLSTRSPGSCAYQTCIGSSIPLVQVVFSTRKTQLTDKCLLLIYATTFC